MIHELPSGLVLAGGRSSRFGEDKAGLVWGSVNFLDHACALLALLCREVLIASGVTTGSRRWPAGARVVPDRHPGCGPLAGMEAGLDAMAGDWLLVLPIDMPLVPLEILRWWPESRSPEADVVLAEKPGGDFQVFPLLLARRTLPVLTSRLERLDYRVRAALEEMSRVLIPEDRIRACDQAGSVFQNINHREDYDRLRSLFPLGGEKRDGPGHG